MGVCVCVESGGSVGGCVCVCDLCLCVVCVRHKDLGRLFDRGNNRQIRRGPEEGGGLL